MNANGRLPDAPADGAVLRWPGRVLAADDLRRSLNGHREVVVPEQAVITPLAAEQRRREGLPLTELSPAGNDLPCRWARAVAECVRRRECRGGVVFCDDPGLVCCVANKVAGLRAVAVTTV